MKTLRAWTDLLLPTASNALTSQQFTALLNSLTQSTGHYPSEELPFVSDSVFYGSEEELYDNPFLTNAMNPRKGLEMILQFDAYPNIGFPGLTDEIATNPQQFSLLLFDHKRQSHWGLTLNQLIGWISAVGLVPQTAGSPAPNINVSMSLLSEPAFRVLHNQQVQLQTLMVTDLLASAMSQSC